MLKRLLKILLWSIGVFIVLIIAFVLYVKIDSSMKDPVNQASKFESENVTSNNGLQTLGNNWFRRSESGLYEVYIEGSAYDRGVAYGELTKDLVYYQEKVFTDQIHKLVPNNFWLQSLKVFIGYFNRDIDEFVPEENKQEIFGVSKSASHEFDDIAPAYQRMMNYHGAHDIGHALQNMSLVGCTSFATWDEASEDSTLIIGRNFDFYVGDDFARDKIVAFFRPDSGHAFMMVTFGGMTGVLSGMNEQGLTITLNAAKSEVPSSTATPVSIVARQILQYASTIEEAYQIASSFKTFVAESFLIGSAKDNQAAIIEKSPEVTELVYSDRNRIVCTNHFQGKILGRTELNRQHMETSASVYRYERVSELLDRNGRNSVQKTADLLRNQLGKSDLNIGMGNEKAVCQLVAHHGIIFQPQKRLVWVSSSPWQLGKMVCYDLNQVFGNRKVDNKELFLEANTIAPDSFLQSTDYKKYLKFSPYRFVFNTKPPVLEDSLVRWNPQLYQTYMIVGDDYFEKKNYSNAKRVYQIGLTKEVATEQERSYMLERITECEEKLK